MNAIYGNNYDDDNKLDGTGSTCRAHNRTSNSVSSQNYNFCFQTTLKEKSGVFSSQSMSLVFTENFLVTF